MFFFFFFAENGEVYVCGQNNRGQLGCDQNANILTLQFCPTPSHKLKNVACGWDFTLFLTGEQNFKTVY